MKWRSACLLALLLAFPAARAAADQVSVAVASNFTAPLQAIVALYAERSDDSIRVSSASSGKLFAQIQHGAPFDVFLSADSEKPDALIASGEALAESRFTYALGRLALWSSQAPPGAQQRLESGDFRHLAIANPRLAPYGRAAKEALEHMGQLDAAEGKLVTGENIAQTWQFVATGNAELGFVALSQVIDGGEVPPDAWVVPREFHAPIRQDAVLLASAADKPAARALLEFLRSPEAAAIIRAFGYDVES